MSTSFKLATSATLAAVTLALSAAAFATDAPNGSKGNSDCATAETSCKGQNACKGHGFKAIKAAACLSANGTIGDLK
jgi:hypothetical protein